MKNKPISEEEKAAIRVEVKAARKAGTPTLKAIAEEHRIHPTMISKIAPNGAPKRKTNKVTQVVKANPAPIMYTEAELDQAYEEYVSLRHATSEARARFMEIAKGLS